MYDQRYLSSQALATEEQVINIVHNRSIQSLFSSYGVNIMNVSWDIY